MRTRDAVFLNLRLPIHANLVEQALKRFLFINHSYMSRDRALGF